MVIQRPWTLHLDGHLNTFNPSLRSPSQHFVRSPHHIFIVHPDNVNSRLRDNPVLFGIDVLDAKYPNQQILTLDNYIFKLMSIHSLKWTVRIDTQNPGNNCVKKNTNRYRCSTATWTAYTAHTAKTINCGKYAHIFGLSAMVIWLYMALWASEQKVNWMEQSGYPSESLDCCDN